MRRWVRLWIGAAWPRSRRSRPQPWRPAVRLVRAATGAAGTARAVRRRLPERDDMRGGGGHRHRHRADARPTRGSTWTATDRRRRRRAVRRLLLRRDELRRGGHRRRRRLGRHRCHARRTAPGRRWDRYRPLRPLRSVSCVAPSRCMAVGSANSATAGWTAAALFSFDGGNTWAAAATPLHQLVPTALVAVAMPVQTALLRRRRRRVGDGQLRRARGATSRRRTAAPRDPGVLPARRTAS